MCCAEARGHLGPPALLHLVLLRRRGDDNGHGGHGVRRQSRLTALTRREAGRLKVPGAEAGVGTERALVPLRQHQPPPPPLRVLGEPAGHSLSFQSFETQKESLPVECRKVPPRVPFHSH